LKETGANVVVKGKYYPDRSLAVEGVPPMFLHITASSQRGLNAGLKMIQEFINSAGIVSTKEKLFDPRFVNATVDVGIEQEPRFNVRSKVMGPGGSYIKYIHQSTGCKVQLKGKGSGFVDPSTGLECDDNLFFHIVGNAVEKVEIAKKLVEELIETTRQEHVKHLSAQLHASAGGYGGGYSMQDYGYGVAAPGMEPSALQYPPGIGIGYHGAPGMGGPPIPHYPPANAYPPVHGYAGYPPAPPAPGFGSYPLPPPGHPGLPPSHYPAPPPGPSYQPPPPPPGF